MHNTEPTGESLNQTINQSSEDNIDFQKNLKTSNYSTINPEETQQSQFHTTTQK